jgi:hypothetical protein
MTNLVLSLGLLGVTMAIVAGAGKVADAIDKLRHAIEDRS